MIQRIQTIHMFLSVVIGIVALVLGLGASESDIVAAAFNDGFGRYVYLALILLGVVIVAWSIFMYNNRRRQMRFVSLSTTLFALATIELAACYFLTESQASWAAVGPYLPLATIVLNLMAKSRIKYDEQLVAAADRIR